MTCAQTKEGLQRVKKKKKKYAAIHEVGQMQ